MADKLSGHVAETGRSIPYPEDNGAEWDRVKLGPHVLPGSWSVTGAVKRRVDVKTTKGQDGARFRDRGYKPGLLTLRGDLVGAEDWNSMVSISKILTPRSRGVSMKPLPCEHPTFTYLGITNVLVLEVLAPVVDGGKITCSIRVQEWMKKPKKKPDPPELTGVSDFANGKIQRAARDAVWAIPPSAEFDQFNIEGNFDALPGFEPEPKPEPTP